MNTNILKKSIQDKCTDYHLNDKLYQLYGMDDQYTSDIYMNRL